MQRVVHIYLFLQGFGAEGSLQLLLPLANRGLGNVIPYR